MPCANECWISSDGWAILVTKKPSTINHHPEAEAGERDHRNFIHRILTTAHKLDLPRCYEAEQFDHAMAKCRELSVDTPAQQADYIRMIRYAIDLIQAHGNTLRTELSSDNCLQDCYKNYCSPFEKVSRNMRQLREMTDTVTRPGLKEAGQFPLCEDNAILTYVLTICQEIDRGLPGSLYSNQSPSLS